MDLDPPYSFVVASGKLFRALTLFSGPEFHLVAPKIDHVLAELQILERAEQQPRTQYLSLDLYSFIVASRSCIGP
jgi:hypothetical protein